MTVHRGLIFDAIIFCITMATVVSSYLRAWWRSRSRFARRIQVVCGRYDDDGLTVCSRCTQTGPHDQFEAYQQRERLGLVHWVPVTYYQCKGGCWPW